MSMHEVTKYNRNFKTGEYYEQKVIKPDQASRNCVTIQLHDAETGELIEEAYTENAITSSLESYAYAAIAKRLNIGTNLNGFISEDYMSPSAIVLSDSDIGEMEDPYFIHGNIKGVCNWSDTDPGSDFALRGFFNAAESYSRIEDGCIRHIHRVYDWPTSAGNGKIQSIFWMTRTVRYESTLKQTAGLSPITISPIQNSSTYYKSISGANYIFDRQGNLICRTGSGTDSNPYIYRNVLNMLQFVNGCEEPKLSNEERYWNTHEVNGYFYSIGYSYTNANTESMTYYMSITKKDAKGNIVDSWEEDVISDIPQLVELRKQGKLGSYSTPSIQRRWYCDFDGWIAVSIRYSCASTLQSADRFIFPGNYNSTTETYVDNYATYCDVYTFYNVLTKRWLFPHSPWEIKTFKTYSHKIYDWRCLYKNDDSVYCSDSESSVSKYMVTIGTNGYSFYMFYNPEIVPGESNSSYNSSSINAYSKMHPTLPIARCSDSNSPFCALTPLYAHTKLASPINKTTLNTMKIQYDFFFKIPLPYMPSDKVWALYE